MSPQQGCKSISGCPKLSQLLNRSRRIVLDASFLRRNCFTKLCPLLIEHLQPSQAFIHTSVDLFGPFYIRDTAKKHTFGNRYRVIFTCLYSRAVQLELAEGYDTKSFMLVLRRFVSLLGYPGTLTSDRGSQLTGASKELKKAVESWNWDSIFTFGEKHNMK